MSRGLYISLLNYFGHFEGENLLYRTKEEEEFHQYCRLLQHADGYTYQ